TQAPASARGRGGGGHQSLQIERTEPSQRLPRTVHFWNMRNKIPSSHICLTSHLRPASAGESAIAPALMHFPQRSGGRTSHSKGAQKHNGDQELRAGAQQL